VALAPSLLLLLLLLLLFHLEASGDQDHRRQGYCLLMWWKKREGEGSQALLPCSWLVALVASSGGWTAVPLRMRENMKGGKGGNEGKAERRRVSFCV